MAEGASLIAEQLRRLNRDLMEKVLDRAASDPEWRQRLLDDPEVAIQEADFPEVRRLREMRARMEAQEAEVAGQMSGAQGITLGGPICNWR